MDMFNVIIRPLVTEKGTHQTTVSHDETNWKVARGGAYSFEVHTDANKGQIKHAVESIYNVSVLSVRTAMRKGKRRRFRHTVGQTPSWKKAMVVLAPGSHIDLF